MQSEEIVLYSYWRSSSSWRVRIVLEFKNLAYTYSAVNLLKGEQTTEEYAEMNPGKLVPSISIDGISIVQSTAICEYLEETRPEKSLLPSDPKIKATVREIVNMIACDIQPIQNVKILKKIGADQNEEAKAKWANHWIEQGFIGLEKKLEKTCGKYCVKDEITFADCYLVPQVYNAVRWGVDVSKFPNIFRINESLNNEEFIKKSHPEASPDKF